MGKKIFIAIFILAAIVSVNTANAANLIINGDFESGNTGFFTNYSYDNLLEHTEYAIVSNPHSFHPGAADMTDHTSGSGFMMAVNGSTNGSNIVWQQEVEVLADKDYNFSLWLSNWTSSYQAVLEVKINGSAITSFFQGGLGVWGEFAQSWNSGSNITALIQIYDLQGAVNGNDFALDDIRFDGPATAVPVPGSLILILAGGLGGVLLKKRNRSKSRTFE